MICNAFQRFSDWSHEKWGVTCFHWARIFSILFLLPCFYGAYCAFEGEGLEWVIGIIIAFGFLTILRDFLKKISWLEQQGSDSNEKALKGSARKALIILAIAASIPAVVFQRQILFVIFLLMLPLLVAVYFMACIPHTSRHSEQVLDFRKLDGA